MDSDKAAPFVDAAPLPLASPLALERRVRALGAGFFLLFFSYIALQQLQSSVNGDLGYYGNLSAYLCFSVSSITAPYFISRAHSLNVLLGLSALFYLWFMSMNIPNPVFVGPYLASAAAVGVFGVTLWVGQATYVARCAAAVALATGEAVTDAASRLNGVFFFAFQFSGCVGGTFAALMLMFAGQGGHTLLFSVLTFVGVCAMLLLCCLVEPSAPGQAFLALPRCRGSGGALRGGGGGVDPPGGEAPTPAAFFRFLYASRRLKIALPLFFVMGAFQAVGFSTLTAAMVAPSLGVSFVAVSAPPPLNKKNNAMLAPSCPQTPQPNSTVDGGSLLWLRGVYYVSGPLARAKALHWAAVGVVGGRRFLGGVHWRHAGVDHCVALHRRRVPPAAAGFSCAVLVRRGAGLRRRRVFLHGERHAATLVPQRDHLFVCRPAQRGGAGHRCFLRHWCHCERALAVHRLDCDFCRGSRPFRARSLF